MAQHTTGGDTKSGKEAGNCSGTKENAQRGLEIENISLSRSPHFWNVKSDKLSKAWRQTWCQA